jgi:hypothetical protein
MRDPKPQGLGLAQECIDAEQFPSPVWVIFINTKMAPKYAQAAPKARPEGRGNTDG